MAESLFDFVAGLLEERTDLDALEARGTLRIALKDAGLDPKALDRTGLLAALEQRLPKQLAARAVPDPDTVCAQLAGDVRRASAFETRERASPEDVCRRLRGN
jgi:hypothetical protein